MYDQNDIGMIRSNLELINQNADNPKEAERLLKNLADGLGCQDPRQRMAFVHDRLQYLENRMRRRLELDSRIGVAIPFGTKPLVVFIPVVFGGTSYLVAVDYNNRRITTIYRMGYGLESYGCINYKGRYWSVVYDDHVTGVDLMIPIYDFILDNDLTVDVDRLRELIELRQGM